MVRANEFARYMRVMRSAKKFYRFSVKYFNRSGFANLDKTSARGTPIGGTALLRSMSLQIKGNKTNNKEGNEK